MYSMSDSHSIPAEGWFPLITFWTDVSRWQLEMKLDRSLGSKHCPWNSATAMELAEEAAASIAALGNL